MQLSWMLEVSIYLGIPKAFDFQHMPQVVTIQRHICRPHPRQ